MTSEIIMLDNLKDNRDATKKKDHLKTKEQYKQSKVVSCSPEMA